MIDDGIDALWLDSGGWSLAALVRVSGMTEGELLELVDYGALIPDNPDIDAGRWIFGGHCVMVVQKAMRLRRDFDLDPPGLALALTLIGRIDEMENEIRHLRVLLPRRNG